MEKFKARRRRSTWGIHSRDAIESSWVIKGKNSVARAYTTFKNGIKENVPELKFVSMQF